jgi:hypothetical protein
VKLNLNAGVSKRFRLLKWNELVSRGDFVVDELRGFEPWEGPADLSALQKPFDCKQTIEMNGSRCPRCGVKALCRTWNE